jgi:hypothetical protein
VADKIYSVKSRNNCVVSYSDFLNPMAIQLHLMSIPNKKFLSFELDKRVGLTVDSNQNRSHFTNNQPVIIAAYRGGEHVIDELRIRAALTPFTCSVRTVIAHCHSIIYAFKVHREQTLTRCGASYFVLIRDRRIIQA